MHDTGRLVLCKQTFLHVCFRLPESIHSWEAIPQALLVDGARLVKLRGSEADV
jgi:hypothetical protein